MSEMSTLSATGHVCAGVWHAVAPGTLNVSPITPMATCAIFIMHKSVRHMIADVVQRSQELCGLVRMCSDHSVRECFATFGEKVSRSDVRIICHGANYVAERR
jgi:hypothetical protein